MIIEKIIKRDGTIVPFNKNKISFAILRAAISQGGRNKKEAERIAGEVEEILCQRQNFCPSVEEVQDLVEKRLIENGHARTAKAYIVYRYEHTLKRAGKKNLTYSSGNVPYKKLWHALSWAVDHECVSLNQISHYIQSGKMKQLIQLSEEYYNTEVDTAFSLICERIENLKLIVIAGPSSSGKTTTTIKISEKLQTTGCRLVPLNIDNYFFNLETHPRDTFGDYDFETPQALDLELINKQIKILLEGGEVSVPRYNFKTGRREGSGQKLRLAEGEILLIDSLHGLFPAMTEGIEEQEKLNLYIETLSQIKDKEGIYLRWTDIRMMRRMIRDMQFRNCNPRQTILHWHHVRRSELRYIVSRLNTADAVINSFLPYELSILKQRLHSFFPEFIHAFKDLPGREDAYERAIRINGLFKDVTSWSDESIVPPRSLLREFIGKSAYTY